MQPVTRKGELSRNSHEKFEALLGQNKLQDSDFHVVNGTRVGFSLDGIKRLIPLVKGLYSNSSPELMDESNDLTEFQSREMRDQFVQKWISSDNSVFKNTDLVDFRSAVSFARESYIAYGHGDAMPKIFMICDSPVSCAMVYRMCDDHEVLEYLGCGRLWGLLDRETLFKPDSEYFDVLVRHNEAREEQRLKSSRESVLCEPQMYHNVLRSAIESLMIAANGVVDRKKLDDASLLGPVGLLSKKFGTLSKIKSTMFDGCKGDLSWWSDQYAAVSRFTASEVSAVRRQIQAAINLQAYGNSDAECSAFWDWNMQMGCENAEKCFPLVGMSMVCGWWLASSITCLLQNRPHAIGIDAELRALHSETGPALAYRDGYEYWYIEGQRCDEQLVMSPETQTVEQIENETNADLKTIRIARFAGVDSKGQGNAGEGWAKYVRLSGMIPVDHWTNPMTSLPEALFRDLKDSESQVLMASCPTGRPFGIPVPKRDANGMVIGTCEQAQKWVMPRPGLNVIGRT